MEFFKTVERTIGMQSSQDNTWYYSVGIVFVACLLLFTFAGLILRQIKKSHSFEASKWQHRLSPLETMFRMIIYHYSKSIKCENKINNDLTCFLMDHNDYLS